MISQLKKKELVKRVQEEVDFKILINFNFKVQRAYKSIEDILKETATFWENITDRSVGVWKIYKIAFRLTEKLLNIQKEAMSITKLYFDSDFLKLFYQFILILGFKQKQFRIMVLKFINSVDFKHRSQSIKHKNQNYKLGNKNLIFICSTQGENNGKIHYVNY